MYTNLILVGLFAVATSQLTTEKPDVEQLEELARLLTSASTKDKQCYKVWSTIKDFNFDRSSDGLNTDIDDIVLTNSQVSAVIAELRSKKHKRQLGKLAPKWPLNQPITYQFHEPDVKFSMAEKKIVEDALKEMELETCLTFRHASGTTSGKLQFVKSIKISCTSPVGDWGTDYINLHETCMMKTADVQHEVMHTLGFFHEQQRKDAKEFVIYNRSAVEPLEEIQFFQPASNLIDDMDTPYDFGSIMHYGSKLFTIHAGRTLTSRDKSYLLTMGQRTKMSFLDIYRINKVYCNDVCSKSKIKCQHQGYANVKNCSTCTCPYGLDGRLCNYAAKSDSDCGYNYEATNSSKSVSLIDAKSDNVQFRNCNWKFKSDPGHVVVLQFETKFQLPCYNDANVCEHSYMEMKLQKDLRATGFRLCCGESPSEAIKSEGQFILLLFRLHGNGETLPEIRVTYRQEPVSRALVSVG